MSIKEVLSEIINSFLEMNFIEDLQEWVEKLCLNSSKVPFVYKMPRLGIAILSPVQCDGHGPFSATLSFP